MGIFRSIAGNIELELTGADPENSLRALNEVGVRLQNVRPVGELSYRFVIGRKDYKRVKQLADRLGNKIVVTAHFGMIWTIGKLKKRPVLLVGITALLLLTMYLPTRICFVRVDGNAEVPAQLIIDRAERCGIYFGASRREVRSEKMKNALLSAIPELQWAGVNTRGCVAVISVREKTATETEIAKPAVSSIVANRDAVIVTCTAEKGTLVCKVGQAVKCGDLLISGVMDCGIAIRAERSVGEVYGQTNRTLAAITPSEYVYRTVEIVAHRKYGLIIGKKRINFYKDSGILGTTCDKMSTVKYLTLPGGFVLPVALVEEQWISYQNKHHCISEFEAEKILTDFADKYMALQMLAGRVLARNQVVSAEKGIAMLDGHYACLEMIGREISEESIIDYGENH